MNPFVNSRVGGGGGSGGSPNDPDNRELQLTGYETTQFVRENIQRLTNAAWTTFLTMAYTGTIAQSYGRGIIEAVLGGVTQNVGSGLRKAQWYFDYSGAAPTVAKIGTDVTSGGGPADFQLVVSGNNILLQAKSSDGVNTMAITAYTKIVVPALGGMTSMVIS